MAVDSSDDELTAKECPVHQERREPPVAIRKGVDFEARCLVAAPFGHAGSWALGGV